MTGEDAAVEALCWKCDGTGCEEACGWRGGCRMAHAGPDSHRICSTCHGSGRVVSGRDDASVQGRSRGSA